MARQNSTRCSKNSSPGLGLYKFLAIACIVPILISSCGNSSSSDRQKASNITDSLTNQGEKPRLSDYPGNFTLLDSASFTSINVLLKDDRIFGVPSDDKPAELFFERDDIFNAPRYRCKVKFTRDDSGAVVGMLIYLDGKKFKAVKER